MIDTHCHLTYPGLGERVEQVLADAATAGVDRMISVGTSPTDAAAALRIADAHAGVYVAAGLHPGHADEAADTGALQQELRSQLAHPRVVAVGEMGLDQHYPEPPLEQQRRVFAAQLELMQERPELPGIIHNREATDATLEMVRASGVAGDRLVFHCFTGPAEELRRILDLGAMVSFTGIVTFAGAAAVAEASDLVPLDRLMIETDSPYLTPAPFRKVRPNEPRFVAEVAKFLADRRGMPRDEFVAAVDANAERFFRLPVNG